MMKKYLLPLLSVLWLCLPVLGQEETSQAEQLYRQGRFADALLAYEQELKNYPNDPFLYYNIGNAYFKMGSTGLAVANYYRAYRLLPRDHDIRHNLSLALSSCGEQLVPTDIPAAAYNAFFYLSYDELKGLTFALFWVTAFGLFIWLTRRKGLKAVLIVGIGLLICSAWWYARYQLESKQLAVVAAPSAELRSGPGTNFPANATAAQGHLLTIVDKKDRWYEVVLDSQSVKGWVESQAIEKI